MSDWTTPDDARAEVQRAWDRGRILAARLAGATLFPMPLRCRRPDACTLGERFDDVRQWIRALEEGSRERRGAGYAIEWAEIDHRQLGRNRVPRSLVVPTEADALSLIGMQRQASQWQARVDRTVAEFPALRAWIERRPLALVENAADWDRILSTLRWFAVHPRPGIYLRQADIPDVDTKFVGTRRALRSKLLDVVLPP